VLFGELQQLLSAVERHRHARRVLKRRQQVHEARLPHQPPQRLVEAIDDQAVVIDGDRDVVRLHALPAGQGAHEGRRFSDDRVAQVERDAPDQVQPLQRASQDGDVLGSNVDAHAGQASDDQLAQAEQALGWSVGQHAQSVLEDRARVCAL